MLLSYIMNTPIPRWRDGLLLGLFLGLVLLGISYLRVGVNSAELTGQVFDALLDGLALELTVVVGALADVGYARAGLEVVVFAGHHGPQVDVPAPVPTHSRGRRARCRR